MSYAKHIESSVSLQQFDTEADAWQDLIGIAADPPDQREKCDYCR